jgi:predicted ATPase
VSDHTAFAGRHAELKLLEEALRAAHAATPSLVLLEGPAGIGKSALLQAFAARDRGGARRRIGFFLLSPQEGEEYSPVLHAALAATDHRLYRKLGGKRQASRVAQSLYKEWLGALPGPGNLIAAITATYEAVVKRRRGPRLPAQLAVDDYAAALQAASRRRPVVLLLDQLEEARAESIDHLERLVTTADTGCRLLVVCAFRPASPGAAEPPIVALKRKLALKEVAYRSVALGPLPPDELAASVGLRFRGAEIPAEFLEWLNTASAGHPGMAGEVLAHLQMRKSIRRELGRWRLEVDEGYLATLTPPPEPEVAELKGVEGRLLDILAAAAALGEEFEVVSLASRLGRDELELEDELAGAGHLRLITYVGERDTPEGELTTVYRFASPHLRAALVRRASAPGAGTPRGMVPTGPATG